MDPLKCKISKNFSNNFEDNNCQKRIQLTNTTLKSFPTDSSITFRKKYFLIRKFLKYDKVMNQISQSTVKLPKKKIHFISINKNLAKLNDIQKLKHMKLLSKLIRKERRKINIISVSLEQKMERIFKKLINKGRIGNKKDKNTIIGIKLKNLINAMKKLQENESMHFSNEKNIIQDLLDLIVSRLLKPNSLQFKIISTQIRMLLNEVNHISTKNKYVVSIPDKNIHITAKEHRCYKKYLHDFNIVNAIFGTKNNIEFEYQIFENGERSFKEYENNDYNELNLFNDYCLNENDHIDLGIDLDFWK